MARRSPLSHNEIIAKIRAQGRDQGLAQPHLRERQVRRDIPHAPFGAQRGLGPLLLAQALEQVGRQRALSVDMTPFRVTVHARNSASLRGGRAPRR